MICFYFNKTLSSLLYSWSLRRRILLVSTKTCGCQNGVGWSYDFVFFWTFFTDIIVGEKDKNQNIPYMADLIWQGRAFKKNKLTSHEKTPSPVQVDITTSKRKPMHIHISKCFVLASDLLHAGESLSQLSGKIKICASWYESFYWWQIFAA